MADPAFIQEVQMVQTMNYLTVITFSQEARIDHIWQPTMKMNIEESTVELYDRLVPSRQSRTSFVASHPDFLLDAPTSRYARPVTLDLWARCLILIARGVAGLSKIDLLFAWLLTIPHHQGFVRMYLAVAWAQNIFILTMQGILVVRIYVLFNRSKKLLIFLATLYCLQSIAMLVMGGLSMTNQVLRAYFVSVSPAIGSVGQIVNLNASAFLLFYRDTSVLNVTFDTMLLLFALRAFVRHALEAKTLDGGWSINVLVRTLVADHLVFFVVNLTWLSLSVAANYITESNVFTALLTEALNVFTALAVVAGPRMVISLRAIEKKTRREVYALKACYVLIRATGSSTTNTRRARFDGLGEIDTFNSRWFSESRGSEEVEVSSYTDIFLLFQSSMADIYSDSNEAQIILVTFQGYEYELVFILIRVAMS
ncbi:hypothetical protein BJ138DRAFT_1106315 [Hygrophoropsis aurantiaca]|uniref:Uncharacterized protein n=1 Tax=Hygrophoropsis aurantiaca TaxID=72124 RepID=A0ACB7ZVE0_9AGAM|nr:hypothetical protein BJ138DRAFT_1106315 [Hygrophoropsis aurantiaca]